QYQNRRVVHEHRERHRHQQGYEHSKLQVDLPHSFQEASGRIERSCDHEPAPQDHQRADRDQRMMPEARKGERQAVGGAHMRERKEIQTDGNDRDGQERHDLHRHAPASEGDKHGHGDRDSRSRVEGGYRNYRPSPVRLNSAMMVPLARLERALPKKLDFESSASTSSATGASAMPTG